MKPRSYIAWFALITLAACIGTVHYVEAVSGLALVIGAVIGAAIGPATAMSYVKRYSTEKLPPPRNLWKRIAFYAIGVPVAWVLSDKLPYVPGIGDFVRTGGWVVFLVMGTTVSVGVGIWWRFAGQLQARR